MPKSKATPSTPKPCPGSPGSRHTLLCPSLGCHFLSGIESECEGNTQDCSLKIKEIFATHLFPVFPPLGDLKSPLCLAGRQGRREPHRLGPERQALWPGGLLSAVPSSPPSPARYWSPGNFSKPSTGNETANVTFHFAESWK